MTFAGLGRFDAALGACTVAMLGVVGVAFPLCHLAISWRSLLPLSFSVGALAVLLVFYGWRKEARLTAVLRTAIWTLILSNLFILPLYLPMRHAAPLADPWLARIDHAVGFDDGRLVAWVGSHDALSRLSSRIYDSLTLLCLFAVMATSFMGKVLRAENLLLAILVGVVLTIAVAFVFPAIGPWEMGGFTPTGAQSSCGVVIRVLRGGSLYTVDLANPDPIIATPSWHVILAVLAALALRPLRIVGPLSCVWGALIVVSTLTTGWHYLVDVVCGVLVASGSHALAWKGHPEDR